MGRTPSSEDERKRLAERWAHKDAERQRLVEQIADEEGRVQTATVTVTLTFPEGMWDDPAAVVQEVLADPMYGIATSDSVTVVTAPASPPS